MFTGRALRPRKRARPGWSPAWCAPEALEATLAEIAADASPRRRPPRWRWPSAASTRGWNATRAARWRPSCWRSRKASPPREWRRAMSRLRRAVAWTCSRICPVTTAGRAGARRGRSRGDVEAIVAPGGRLTYAALARGGRAHRARRCSAARRAARRPCRALHGQRRRSASRCFYAAALARRRHRAGQHALRGRGDGLCAAAVARRRAVPGRGRLLKVDFVAMLREHLPGRGRDAARCRAAGPAARRRGRRRRAARRPRVGGVPGGRQRHRCRRPAHADDILLIQYTSGTTPFPKGVLLTHRNMLRQRLLLRRRGWACASPTASTPPALLPCRGHHAVASLPASSTSATLVTMDASRPARRCA